MVMEVKLSINKYFQIFYTVGPGYRRMAKFIVVE
jgi:hypothetical protein